MDYTPLPDDICKSLLSDLFRSIPALLEIVSPDGFKNSELVKVYHPTPEQQYREYRFSQLRSIKLGRLFKKPFKIEPTKSYDEFLKAIKPDPIKEEYEIASIFGDCIWDIFSNNHTVLNGQNESYHLGSWRGSGSFIADIINDLEIAPDSTFDYMDFYMGSFVAQERADLTGVYEFIFKKLKEQELDWEYSFPQLGIIDFERDEQKSDPPEKYNPNQAIKDKIDRNEKKKAVNKLQDDFDRMYENARYKKPSQEVLAYFNVFGHWPKGHPLAGK